MKKKHFILCLKSGHFQKANYLISQKIFSCCYEKSMGCKEDTSKEASEAPAGKNEKRLSKNKSLLKPTPIVIQRGIKQPG